MRYVFELTGYTLQDLLNSNCILYDYHEFNSFNAETNHPNIEFTSGVEDSKDARLSIPDFDEDNVEDYSFEEMYLLLELGDGKFEFYVAGLDVAFEGAFELTIKPHEYRGHFTSFNQSYSNLKLLNGFKELSKN